MANRKKWLLISLWINIWGPTVFVYVVLVLLLLLWHCGR